MCVCVCVCVCDPIHSLDEDEYSGVDVVLEVDPLRGRGRGRKVEWDAGGQSATDVRQHLQ